MPTSYTYSLETDFSGSINKGQLHKEIEDNGTITTQLYGVDVLGDVVTIKFVSSLSKGESTELDTVKGSHTPDNSKLRQQFYNIVPSEIQTSNTTYTSLTTFIYSGSDSIGTIDYIDILGYMDSSNTSYDVKIVNISNNTIIAEKTGLKNDTIQKIDMGTISNVPTSEAIFELQLKSNKNKKKSYITNIVIYFGNQ